MKLFRRIFISFGIVLFVALCGIMVLGNWNGAGFKTLAIPTGSMKPAIAPGAMVLMRQVPLSSLKVGDIITYKDPQDTRRTISHRIIKTYMLEGKVPSFVTKGDANPSEDQPIVGGLVQGKVIFTAPFLGTAMAWSRTLIGMSFVLYLPALLIVIEELKRLAKYYKAMEPYRLPGYIGSHLLHKDKTVNTGAIKMAALIVVVMPLAIAYPVHAMLQSNTVSLANNTLSVAPIATDHIVIQQVIFSGADTSVCLPQGTNASISNTGPGSVNVIHINSHCTFDFTTHTWIHVHNNSNQSSSTGDANSSGNTNSGNATSGDASNTNNTEININVNNGNGGSGGSAGQAVVIYNPTNQPVNLKNWILTDNSGAINFITGNKIIAAHGYFILNWPVSNGLSNVGDRLILKNPQLSVIDAASWGTDTSQLNPSIPTTATTTSITRTPPGTDTNTAADWQTVP